MASFRHIIGHRHLTLMLSRALARETLPPTLMFTGPAGVGKFATAQALAAAANCLASRDLSVSSEDGEAFPLDACEGCRSCERIARGTHVDVRAVLPDDRASIKVDAVREALAQTAYRPFEGRRRFVIIRDADALELAAQHALLKSLEEPPPGSVFVLTTTMPDALLATVQSRCVRLRFGRLRDREVAAILSRDHDLSESDARAAAAAAGGRVAEALALDSADAAELRTAALLFLRHVAAASGVPGRVQAATSLTVGQRKDRTREEVAGLLRVVASMLRDIEVLNRGGDVATLANPTVSDALSALAPRFDGGRARDAFAAVDRALVAVSSNAGNKVVSEWLALQV